MNVHYVPFSARCTAVQQWPCVLTRTAALELCKHRFVCTLALAGQSLDSNATLGNADLAYKFHYFDGVVLPVGLGVSLFLNGLLLVRYTALNISKRCTLSCQCMYAPHCRLHYYDQNEQEIVPVFPHCSEHTGQLAAVRSQSVSTCRSSSTRAASTDTSVSTAHTHCCCCYYHCCLHRLDTSTKLRCSRCQTSMPGSTASSLKCWSL
jgi:hypothetical protein